jgi:alpha-D-xyloside xylohydrolase
LTIHVFAGADGQFTLYEDQGSDMGYARGELATIQFAWDDEGQSLRIGAREGRFPGMAGERGMTIVLHHGEDSGDVFEARSGKRISYSGQEVLIEF